MRSGKAIRLDDEPWARLMQVKGLLEARDAREYSATDVVTVLIDEMYARYPALAEALRAIEAVKQ